MAHKWLELEMNERSEIMLHCITTLRKDEGFHGQYLITPQNGKREDSELLINPIDVVVSLALYSTT
jgi:hypothetical protein